MTILEPEPPRGPENPSSMTIESPQDRFVALLERHKKIVFKVAGAYGRGAEDRRDLEQEIAGQLWSAFPRYDERRPFSTWMYRVALNVAISWCRASAATGRRSVLLGDSDAEVVDERSPSGTDDRVSELHRAIVRLDELNRALLLLHLEERSTRDIAEILGISETNVTTKLGRLRRRIRNELSAG